MLMEQRDSGKLFAAICASPKIVFDDNNDENSNSGRFPGEYKEDSFWEFNDDCSSIADENRDDNWAERR